MKYLLIALLVTLTGCSALAGKTQQMSVTTEPDDAVITINGHRLGKGHAVSEVKRDSSVSITASKKGCRSHYEHIRGWS